MYVKTVTVAVWFMCLPIMLLQTYFWPSSTSDIVSACTTFICHSFAWLGILESALYIWHIMYVWMDVHNFIIRLQLFNYVGVYKTSVMSIKEPIIIPSIHVHTKGKALQELGRVGMESLLLGFIELVCCCK